MTDYTANRERGEVLIVLDGHPRPLRPSYQAMIAIEEQIGSLIALSYRFASPMQGVTIRDLSVIVTECIRAAGRDRSDTMLTGYGREKVAEYLFEGGVLGYMAPIEDVIHNMITGGAKKNPESPAPETPTPSPIAN